MKTFTIKELRKIYPLDLLGHREIRILFAEKVTVKKSKELPECYIVKSNDDAFAFTFEKPNYKDYTVVA